MLEINYSDLDVDKTIEDLVPIFQRGAILEVLSKSDFSEADADVLGMVLLGDKVPQSYLILTKNPSGPLAVPGGMWSQLKIEAYDLICTKSQKYSSERKDGVANFKSMITVLSSSLGGSHSLPAGVIAGAATLCVMTILKLGVQAYCKTHEPK